MEKLVDDPALTALVEEFVATHKVPGISVGVLHGGTAYGMTHGVTNVDNPLPVDADTLFMIGSTTKAITGTALMRLADEGRLTLKDRVLDHLPEFVTSNPADACAEARRILGLQVWPHRLASGFPEDEVKTSGKTGTLPTLRNEVGVVEYPDGGRYAVACFTRASTLNQKTPAADTVIGHAARLAVDSLRAQA